VRNFSSLVIIILATILYSGCQDTPTDAGYDALPPGDILQIVTLDSRVQPIAIETRTFRHVMSHQASTFLSLGSADGYQAYILLRFNIFPDTIGERGIIRSVKLGLKPAGYGINRAGTFGFTCREITSPWSSSGFTADSIASLSLAPNIAGLFQGSIDTNWISVELDTALGRKWLVQAEDGDTRDILGMLLEPDASTQSIHAFFSASDINYAPQLTIVWEDGAIQDTIATNFLDDTYTVSSPPPQPDELYVQGGLADRVSLSFDITDIPIGSIVNSVEIFVTLDPDRTVKNYRGVDSLLIVERLGQEMDSLAGTAALGRFRDTTGVFVFYGKPLIQAVQKWVNRPQLNYGFIIRSFNEDSDIDRYGLFDSKADSLLRPAIRILYTKQL